MILDVRFVVVVAASSDPPNTIGEMVSLRPVPGTLIPRVTISQTKLNYIPTITTLHSPEDNDPEISIHFAAEIKLQQNQGTT